MGTNCEPLVAEAPILDLDWSISNGTVTSRIYNKHVDFDLVIFPFLDEAVPRRISYVYLNLFVPLEHLIA